MNEADQHTDDEKRMTTRKFVRSGVAVLAASVPFAGVASADHTNKKAEVVGTRRDEDKGYLRVRVKNNTSKTLMRVRFRVKWRGRRGRCGKCKVVAETTEPVYLLYGDETREMQVRMPTDEPVSGWNAEVVDTWGF